MAYFALLFRGCSNDKLGRYYSLLMQLPNECLNEKMDCYEFNIIFAKKLIKNLQVLISTVDMR